MRRGPGLRGAGLTLAVGLAAACASPRSSVPRAYVDQILADPATHLGRPVVLEGRVAAATSVEGRSSFLLADASGKSIEVRTQALPAAGDVVRVLGQVAQDEGNVLVPIVIEARRSGGERPNLLAYGALGLTGAFFVLVLLLEAIGQLATARARPLTELLPVLSGAASAAGAEKVAAKPYAEGDRFRFKALVGPDKGREWVVERRRVYLGRGGSRRNDVEVRDATVSRRQAVVCYSRKKKQVLLINEAETNPTTVNGSVLTKGPLRHGDVLRMGHTALQLYFDTPLLAARPAPPPAPPAAPPPPTQPSPAAPPSASQAPAEPPKP